MLLEFHSAIGYTSSYGVEYALEEYEGATLTYSARGGETVNAVNGQQVYRILQTYLRPGKKYHLRIVPFVYSRSNNRGKPSAVVQATILSPGQSFFLCVCVVLLCCCSFVVVSCFWAVFLVLFIFGERGGG